MYTVPIYLIIIYVYIKYVLIITVIGHMIACDKSPSRDDTAAAYLTEYTNSDRKQLYITIYIIYVLCSLVVTPIITDHVKLYCSSLPLNSTEKKSGLSGAVPPGLYANAR